MLAHRPVRGLVPAAPGVDLPGPAAADLLDSLVITHQDRRGSIKARDRVEVPACRVPSPAGQSPVQRRRGAMPEARDRVLLAQAMSLHVVKNPDNGVQREVREELVDLMLDLVGDSPVRLLDPACGTGTILLAAARRGYSRVEGQELDRSLALVSALRLAFTGASFDVSNGDSLRADAYPRPSTGAVVCSPPFADRNWGAEDLADDPRWEYGTPPRLEPELAWIQHALAHVAPGGPVVMLMPPAAAARPSGRRIRRALVAGGTLRAVISLPPKLAAHYALALQIWVLSRPEPDRAHSHVLLVDTSGFTTRTARAADAISTWAQVQAVVARAWSVFKSSPQLVAGTSDMAIAVPVMELLGEEADLTPARHLRPPSLAVASQADLASRRTDLASRLAELARLLPQLPQPPSGDGAPYRDASLEELAQTGALVIGRAGARSADSEPDPASARARGRILTSQDIARAVPPSGIDEIIIDEVRNSAIRAGDVLVPLIGRRLTARVAGDEDVGAYLSPTVYLIRPDIALSTPGSWSACYPAAAAVGRPRGWPVPSATASASTPAGSESRSSRSRTSAPTASPSAASGTSPAPSAPPTTRAPISSATSSMRQPPRFSTLRIPRKHGTPPEVPNTCSQSPRAGQGAGLARVSRTTGTTGITGITPGRHGHAQSLREEVR